MIISGTNRSYPYGTPLSIPESPLIFEHLGACEQGELSCPCAHEPSSRGIDGTRATILFADKPLVGCGRRRLCAADCPCRGSTSPARHSQCRHHVFGKRLNARTDRPRGRDGLDPYRSSVSLASLLAPRSNWQRAIEQIGRAHV